MPQSLSFIFLFFFYISFVFDCTGKVAVCQKVCAVYVYTLLAVSCTSLHCAEIASYGSGVQR